MRPQIAPETLAALAICESQDAILRPWPDYPDTPRPTQIVDYASVCATLADQAWRPIKITAHMASAVAGSQLLTLDGPLGFGVFSAFMDQPREARWYLPPRTSSWPYDFALPVARWACAPQIPMPSDARLLTPEGQLWGWCVSDAVVQWAGSSIDYFRGTPPVGHMLRLTDAKSINLAAGEFKAIQLPLETHLPAQMELVWYALGDSQGVRDALRRVCQIGKKSRTGHGQVRLDGEGYPMWTVEEVQDGERDAWWRGRDDRGDLRLRRAMPVGWDASVKGYAQALPIRTPHDHISRRAFCHPSGSPC
jgi:hypothetical protein